MTLSWPIFQTSTETPCCSGDFRIYDKPLSGLTQDDRFRQMLAAAQQRVFQPHHILFDSWYARLQNLKAVGWRNRQCERRKPSVITSACPGRLSCGWKSTGIAIRRRRTTLLTMTGPKTNAEGATQPR